MASYVPHSLPVENHQASMTSAMKGMTMAQGRVMEMKKSSLGWRVGSDEAGATPCVYGWFMFRFVGWLLAWYGGGEGYDWL